MFDKVENFNIKKEYIDIYLNFKHRVDKSCNCCFTDIFDSAARLIIHKIYLTNNFTINIDIFFDKINKASSTNRKYFDVAKVIAEKTIKNHYFSQYQTKK